MSLTDIIKNQSFFQNIVDKKEKGALSNAMLFYCEDEETSKCSLILTALMLEYQIYELFNEKSAEYLRIESGIDLDVKIYPKNGEKLLVADSKDIVAEAYIKPVNLPYKIFVIQNFDVSTEEAQNKLLKVLEEPPQNVYFLISAKSEEKVLATIKSRCDKIKINPLSKAEIERVCQDDLANVLGKGYVGKTFELSKNENLKQIARFAIGLITELKTSKQVIKFSKKFLEMKNDINLILEILCFAIEDIIKIKCESENLCSLKQFNADLKNVEPEFSVEALCEIYKLISNLKEKMEFNANLTVAIDNFLLKMLEVKYICK